MAYEFKIVRRIEFSETDMAGIVHFSNFFRYMETAEHAFYRSLGCSVIMKQFEPPLGFPRVHAECDYKRPLRFEDELEIHLLVRAKRSRVITYLFRFNQLTRVDGEAPQRIEVARGILTVVCVSHSHDGNMEAVAIPEQMASQIEIAPAHLLE